MSEPVCSLPGGKSAVVAVSLLKLQGSSLMAGWHVFPEFLCWPRGTCHTGSNVSKL